jgi:hypothetical protein
MPTLALAVLVSCAGPARTDTTYAKKAVSTMDEARSSVETAIVVLESTERHHLSESYVSTSIAEAEADAASALQGFEAVQPPTDASDVVRSRTSAAVGDAVDVLAEARITARRGHAPVELLSDLRRTARLLDALATSVEP